MWHVLYTNVTCVFSLRYTWLWFGLHVIAHRSVTDMYYMALHMEDVT